MDRRRLLAGLLSCGDLDCALRVLDEAARSLPPGEFRRLLGDEEVLRALSGFDADPGVLARRIRGGGYEGLLSSLWAVLDAFEKARGLREPPAPDWLMETVRERLLAGLSTCHSHDCARIKLGTAVGYLRDAAEEFQFSVRESLRLLLRDPRVARLLSSLFPDKPSTYIRGDPRHAILAPYMDLLDAMIQPSAPKTGEERETVPVEVGSWTHPTPSWVRPRRRTTGRRLDTGRPARPHTTTAGEARGRGRGKLLAATAVLALLVFAVFMKPGILTEFTETVSNVSNLVEEHFDELARGATTTATTPQQGSVTQSPANESRGSRISVTVSINTGFYETTSSGVENRGEGERTTIDIYKIIEVVLEEINNAREKHGLPPVSLLNLSIAQFRAEDMLKRGYYGHCDPEGRPPSYWYTLLGGLYYVEENIGVTYTTGELDPVKEAREHVIAMIYDDASSDWGHRDSLLDPTNNYVDIGVAIGDNLFYLVIHMQKVWVEWIQPPEYNETSGVFRASGVVLLNGSTLYTIAIYYMDPESAKVTSYPCLGLSTVACTSCASHGSGEVWAAVRPADANFYYPGVININATNI